MLRSEPLIDPFLNLLYKPFPAYFRASTFDSWGVGLYTLSYRTLLCSLRTPIKGQVSWLWSVNTCL